MKINIDNMSLVKPPEEHRLKLKNESGNVALIVAFAMAVLLVFAAFVLDLGTVYVKTSELQNALDSAALAGARELPADNINTDEWTAVLVKTVAFAADNGITLTADDIEPVYDEGLPANKIEAVEVTKTILVEYNFAKVIGIDSGSVTRSATAGLVPASSVRGAVPLSITSDALTAAINAGTTEDLTIKCATNSADIGINTTDVSGWFGALRFVDNGASVYSYLIAYGYSGKLTVGMTLDMENGNMSGPTMSGFTIRTGYCIDGCTPENYKDNCPRLVYVPVIDVISSSSVKIVGFATFFVTECGGNGNDSYILATYIKNTLVTDDDGPSGAEDFGLYSCRILD